MNFGELELEMEFGELAELVSMLIPEWKHLNSLHKLLITRIMSYR